MMNRNNHASPAIDNDCDISAASANTATEVATEE